MSTIIGLDIGLKGGVALLHHGKLVEAFPMPIITTQPKAKEKPQSDVDVQLLCAYLKAKKPTMIIMEHVHAMPNQGVTSMFSFGKLYGETLATALLAVAPILKVHPHVWVKAVIESRKVTEKNMQHKQKLINIKRAEELFPDFNFILPKCRVAHSGMVDAALLAYYYYNFRSTGKTHD